MGQQVGHGDRSLGLAQHRLSRAAAGVHFDVGEAGNVFGHGVIEAKLAALVQLHDGGAGDRLRHGKDAKHGVGPHGAPVLDIHRAHRCDVRQLAVPRHDREEAGKPSRVDVHLKRGSDLPERGD